MESCDNNDIQRLLRPGKLMGNAGVDVSEGVELTLLFQAFWKVKKSTRVRKMQSCNKDFSMRKRGRINSSGVSARMVVGLRKRAARRLGYCRRPRSVMGNHHHHDQSMSIYRRLKKLQRLIPGGRHMEVDVLFQETAEYIRSLKMQVHLLQTLSSFWSSTNNVPHALGNSNSDQISS